MSKIFEEAEDFKLLRQFSFLADKMVTSSIGTSMTPTTCTIFLLNSLTGLCLLTLPYGFAQAGLLFGTLFLFVCMLLSYITATFMCEALTIANALMYEKAEREVIETMPCVRERLHEEYNANTPIAASSPLLARRGTMDAFASEVRSRHPESEFKIRERVELGQMGEMALHSARNTYLATMVYVVFTLYTIGSSIALTVTVNESLAHTVETVLAMALPGHTWSGDAIYRICVLVSFSVALPLCFSNLQKTRSTVVVVMVLRFTAIVLMLVIATSISVERFRTEGVWEVVQRVPMWEPSNMMGVFGNSIFLYGLHHYLPAMISPLEEQAKAPRVMFAAFFSCFLVIVLVCATALIAWGPETHGKCSEMPGGHFCKIQPFYNLNFSPLSSGGGAIAVFITAYPCLAITSIPVVAITTRNNLTRWMNLSVPADKPYCLKNVLLTLAVLMPANVVALITRDIQAVIAVVGGYAGLTVTVLCPVVLLYRFRQLLRLDDGAVCDAPRPLKSPFANRLGYGSVVIFYAVAILLETKKLFFSAPR